MNFLYKKHSPAQQMSTTGAMKRRTFIGSRIVGRIMLTILAFGGSIGLSVVQKARTTHADTTIYQIVNGPWYLHQSLPTIASATSELMPTGTNFAIACWQEGDNVNGDSVWDYGIDLTTNYQGFVADEGTNTPVTMGNEPAQLTALGIPECVAANTQQPTQNSEPDVTTVFFSPIFDQPHGLPDLPQIADKDYARKDWTSSSVRCSDTIAALDVPPTATTLAGWSKGRLGPIYFLAARPERWGQIQTIILFDPGNTSDFTGADTCDPNYDINALLAGWLSSNAANHLIIYTGAVTEEGPAIGPDSQTPIAQQMNNGSLTTERFTFAGLWKYYLAGIWNQPFANQAQICDYNGMSHEDVLRNFAYTVQSPTSGCPIASNGQQPVAWNP